MDADPDRPGPDPERLADPVSDSDSDSDGDANSDAASDSDSEAEAEADAETDSGSDSEADADSDPVTPDPGPGPERERDAVHVPIEGALDLHAFAPADIPSVVDEYVRAAHAAGFREVRLIHGRGRGVQRGRVQAVLERHPLVAEFWDAGETHLGATVARLIA